MYMVNVMKKIILIVISFMMVFTLSGCTDSEKETTVYGVLGKDNIKEIKYAYKDELNITKLASSLSFWSNLNFYLETSEPSDNVLYVNFLTNSTFVKGLSDDYKNSNFKFKDNDEMRLFMLNSLAYTIRKDIREYDIYFTADGKSINEYLSINDIDFSKAYNKIDSEYVVY